MTDKTSPVPTKDLDFSLRKIELFLLKELKTLAEINDLSDNKGIELLLTFNTTLLARSIFSVAQIAHNNPFKILDSIFKQMKEGMTPEVIEMGYEI